MHRDRTPHRIADTLSGSDHSRGDAVQRVLSMPHPPTIAAATRPDMKPRKSNARIATRPNEREYCVRCHSCDVRCWYGSLVSKVSGPTGLTSACQQWVILQEGAARDGNGIDRAIHLSQRSPLRGLFRAQSRLERIQAVGSNQAMSRNQRS